MKSRIIARVRTVSAVFFIAAVIGIAVSGAPAETETFIVEDGAPNAEIIIAPGAITPVKLAAEDLQRYIEKIDKAFALLGQAEDRVSDKSVYARRIALIRQFMEPLKDVKKELAAGRKDEPPIKADVFKGAELTIDGKLEDPVWSQCSVLEMREIESEKEPAHRTLVKIFWDEKAETFNFGFRCLEDDTDNLSIATRQDGSTRIWNGDYVEVLLETYSHA